MMLIKPTSIIGAISIILFIIRPCTNANSDPIEGRYSFSLTTFHPSGKLPQLSHAIQASTLGPPIIAIRGSFGISLASLQSLPSPLIKDDGTSRFARVTNSIIVGHTGVNADGRVVVEAAQRLAVEHSFTFQEEIPMNILLEEMSLLFQEYTMKPGVRPFGCCLLVASANDGLFRMDPSGTVTKLDTCDEEEGVAFVGRGNEEEIIKRVQSRMKYLETLERDDQSVSVEDVNKILIDVLKEEVTGGDDKLCRFIISASLKSRESGFCYGVNRIQV
jgi:20S proteasome alpha/beta subunit